MKRFCKASVLLAVAAVLGAVSHSQAQSIGFNFASASGTTVASPNNPILPAESAGAPGYSALNWNNLLSDWSGNSGAVPSPIVDSTGATVTGLGITFDGPNAWSNGIATTDGNFKLMRNYLDSGAGDSGYVYLTGVPYRKFDVVVYADGDGSGNTIGPYVLRYGTGVQQAAAQTEAATNVTNLLRPVVWAKEITPGHFAGTYTAVNTNTSLSVAGAATGNYLVFEGIKGNFTIDPTQTSTGGLRAPFNGFQVVNWSTHVNALPGADDPTAKVAMYGGNYTQTVNRTIGSLATSVGTYGDFFINPGVLVTLANGDLDIGDINHWVQGGGDITSSTNTLKITRDRSNGLSYVGGAFGATDAAINGVRMVDNGGNPLNVVKSGGGNLRISTQPGGSTAIAQPYTGTTTISQGSVEIGHAQALGNSASTIQINDAQTSFFNTALYLDDGITLSRNIQVNNLGNGTATLGTLLGSSTHTFSGNVTLNKSATVTAPSGGTVNFSTGIISGAGGISKAGAGTVNLNAANTYTGTTTVTAGTLNILGTGRIYATGAFFGGTGVTNVFVNAGGTLVVDKFTYGVGNSFSEMRNNYYAINIGGGTLRIQGTNSSLRAFTVGTGGATIDVPTGGTYTKLAGTLGAENVIHNTGNNTLTLTGAGTGIIEDALGSQGTWTSAQVVKSGAGTWTLSGNNTYGGGTSISGGILRVSTNDTALGSGGVTFTGSATLATASGGGARDLANPITVNAGQTASFDGGFFTLTLSGAIGGAGNVARASTGTVVFNANNSYLGTTNNPSGGTLQIGTGGANGTLGAGAVTNDGSLVFNRSGSLAVPNNISGGGSVSVVGSGVVTLSGTNGYAGTTGVSNGTLLVNGIHTGGGAYNVASTGTLGGTGSIGTSTFNVDGTLSPGNSIESLLGGTLNLNNGSTFDYELNSSVLNGDLLRATGDLNLTGTVTLALSEEASGVLPIGNKLTLINYSGTWNSGTFNGYADGGTFVLGSNTWQINYQDTSGGSNFAADQTLSKFVTITVVPEPSSLAMLAFGMISLWLFRRR